MNVFSSILLGLAGVINLLPIVGVFSREVIERSYQIDVATADLELLLRHRAILLGLVGVSAIAGAVHRNFFWPASCAAFASMVSYAVLSHLIGVENDALAKVLYADYAGIGLVLAAIALRAARRK